MPLGTENYHRSIITLQGGVRLNAVVIERKSGLELFACEMEHGGEALGQRVKISLEWKFDHEGFDGIGVAYLNGGRFVTPHEHLESLARLLLAHPQLFPVNGTSPFHIEVEPFGILIRLYLLLADRTAAGLLPPVLQRRWLEGVPACEGDWLLH